MTYNHPDTIYYQEAHKLSLLAQTLFEKMRAAWNEVEIDTESSLLLVDDFFQKYGFKINK